MEYSESVITAITVPAGSDHEQLEPSSREQEDARGLDVPQCPDYGRQGAQHYIVYTWLLPQPVSVQLFRHCQFANCYVLSQACGSVRDGSVDRFAPSVLTEISQQLFKWVVYETYENQMGCLRHSWSPEDEYEWFNRLPGFSSSASSRSKVLPIWKYFNC